MSDWISNAKPPLPLPLPCKHEVSGFCWECMIEKSKETPRCQRSGNPCGTDTVVAGGFCECLSCHGWLAREHNRMKIDNLRLRDALSNTYGVVKCAFVNHEEERPRNDVPPTAQVRIKASLRAHIDNATGPQQPRPVNAIMTDKQLDEIERRAKHDLDVIEDEYLTDPEHILRLISVVRSVTSALGSAHVALEHAFDCGVGIVNGHETLLAKEVEDALAAIRRAAEECAR